MAFAVGVSGHRALPDADLAALGVAARGVFAAIADEMRKLHAADQAGGAPLFRPDAPLLRCICGLAEGADAILAEAALAEGWTLAVSLPFAASAFETDFTTEAARQRFALLLARAESVCALDGDRARGAEPYTAVGEQVVEQSDLLLAVWDGLPARGPGGTGDVVLLARRQGVPVAVLPASGPVSLGWDGARGRAKSGDVPGDMPGNMAGDLAALVRQVVMPPADPHGFPASAFDDAPRGTAWAMAAIRLYERIVAAGARAPALPTISGGTAAETQAETAWSGWFAPIDRLATEHAALYRAAGLMRYGLILPATFASLVGTYGTGWLRPAGYLSQFAVLVFLLAFSARGWWERSHRRFIAYRALAELLRNMRMLAPLAAVARMPGAATHLGRSADWTAWYGRAAAREAGLAPVGFDPALLAAACVGLRARTRDQVGFLLSRAVRFDTMGRRLWQIGFMLSMAGIGFSAIRAALLWGAVADTTMRSFNELALLLPAMAPVFLGLLSFNEYSTLATRYRAVAAELQAQLGALDATPMRRKDVLEVARGIAEVLLAETFDWQLLIKARTVSAY